MRRHGHIFPMDRVHGKGTASWQPMSARVPARLRLERRCDLVQGLGPVKQSLACRGRLVLNLGALEGVCRGDTTAIRFLIDALKPRLNIDERSMKNPFSA